MKIVLTYKGKVIKAEDGTRVQFLKISKALYSKWKRRKKVYENCDISHLKVFFVPEVTFQ